jgi:hypothetical protein
LPADASTWVRFVPELNWTGTLDPGITFRAWDQTSGLPGGTANTTTHGGASPFSAATETASITVNPFYGLDADGNGTADALTDGILILRYLFSPPGNWTIDDALGPVATRTTRDTLRSYLNNARTGALDVDGNGTADALTDGILILRYLFAPAGSWNYSDAVGIGATRTTREQIRTFLDQFTPGMAVTARLASVPAAGLAVQEEPAPMAMVEPSNSPNWPSGALFSPSAQGSPTAVDVRHLAAPTPTAVSFTPAQATATGQDDQPVAYQQPAIDVRVLSRVFARWQRSKHESDTNDLGIFDDPESAADIGDAPRRVLSGKRWDAFPSESGPDS